MNISDLIYVKQLIRVILIRRKITFDELKNKIFNNYLGEELICIKEFIKIAQGPILGLDFISAENLGRYLIEPRTNQTLLYDKYREIQIIDLRIKLENLFEIDYPKDFYLSSTQILKSALNQIKQNYQRITSEINQPKIDLLKWQQISITIPLSPIERDFLIAIMADSNNLNQLNFDVYFIHNFYRI